MNDDRYLWPALYQTIKRIKPRWIALENVVGIVNMELGNILDELENEEYQSQAFIIPASAAGAPHRRERVWIIANSYRERCGHGFNSWKIGNIQSNWQRDIKTMQNEWANIFPESWKAFDLHDWMSSAQPGISRMDDGISDWLHRNKALGNAIVPQVIYPILRAIALMEQTA